MHIRYIFGRVWGIPKNIHVLLKIYNAKNKKQTQNNFCKIHCFLFDSCLVVLHTALCLCSFHLNLLQCITWAIALYF